jgi:molybdopterin-guanine dinucleotide biosynthesis protein A
MGQDKSLLPFRGFPTLTHYQVARLAPLFSALHVSTKTDKFDGVFSLIQDNTQETFSPMVALASILETFSDTYVFCLSVDTPLVEASHIEALWETAQRTNANAIIPRDSQTRHPLCGLYHSSLAPLAHTLASQGQHKLGMLLEAAGTTYVDFEETTPFTNLNHPHEYEAALLKQ